MQNTCISCYLRKNLGLLLATAYILFFWSLFFFLPQKEKHGNFNLKGQVSICCLLTTVFYYKSLLRNYLEKARRVFFLTLFQGLVFKLFTTEKTPHYKFCPHVR